MKPGQQIAPVALKVPKDVPGEHPVMGPRFDQLDRFRGPSLEPLAEPEGEQLPEKRSDADAGEVIAGFADDPGALIVTAGAVEGQLHETGKGNYFFFCQFLADYLL